jgi:dihydroxyacetone kinase
MELTRANAGRASYVGARDLAGVADPGAVATAAAFETAAKLIDGRVAEGKALFGAD